MNGGKRWRGITIAGIIYCSEEMLRADPHHGVTQMLSNKYSQYHPHKPTDSTFALEEEQKLRKYGGVKNKGESITGLGGQAQIQIHQAWYLRMLHKLGSHGIGEKSARDRDNCVV